MLNIVPAETEEVLNGKRKRCAPRRFSGQIQVEHKSLKHFIKINILNTKFFFYSMILGKRIRKNIPNSRYDR